MQEETGPVFGEVKRALALFLYYSVLQRLPPSYLPFGRLFKAARYLVCRHLFEHCDPTANIEKGCMFGSGRYIRVGYRSSLGVNAELHGPVSVGNNVMMGPQTIIHTENHSSALTDVPMIDQGYTERQPVRIEDDVWIGARVTILPGVVIGRGSIIGAGAVVSRDVPPFSVAVGNPCRVIRDRRGIGIE